MLECTCEQILQFAPVSVMLIDAEGVITFVNDWHLAHFAKGKWDRDRFIGKKIQELPGIVSAGVSDDIRAILDGRTIHLEAFYTDACSGGQSAYQNLRGTPIRRDGKVVGGIVIRDYLSCGVFPASFRGVSAICPQRSTGPTLILRRPAARESSVRWA